jgi:hypothetical protein
MARIFLAALLSLLLIGMQREALLHDVVHLRAEVARGHEAGFQKVAPGECLECALLASGAHPVPGGVDDIALPAQRSTRLVPLHAFALPASRPAFYRSRAPPLLA